MQLIILTYPDSVLNEILSINSRQSPTNWIELIQESGYLVMKVAATSGIETLFKKQKYLR